ncbi:MAG: DUF4296 domain-containing protein [Chitinophagales bacterium]|nr:DUF4296 domain-containing protein [Chitinophagales bacterium]
MRRNVLFFLMLVLLAETSCKPKSDLLFREDMLHDIPDSIIAADKMISILTDVHLAEAAAQELRSDSVKADVLLKKYYPEILDYYQVTGQQFENSYDYYTKTPLLMNYVYQKIIEKLNLMESENKGANKDKTDSVPVGKNPFKPDIKRKIDSLKKDV